METQTYEDPIEQIIAKRLAHLGSLPVDTTRLERAIRVQIPMPTPSWPRMLRPIAAVAAGLILVAIVGLAFFSSRTAQASPADMAQMHRDLIAGNMAMKVESIEQANKAIAAFAGDFPQLSEPPRTHTMACCMHNVGNKKIACVLLNSAGTPVTMVVANTDAVQTPSVPATVCDGQTYYVQRVGNLNMVMSQRDHHWICLVGELPAEILMELSGGLKFSPIP